MQCVFRYCSGLRRRGEEVWFSRVLNMDATVREQAMVSGARVAFAAVPRATRAALFALVGFGVFAYWLVANPGFDTSPTQGEWPYVLAFSAIILAIALAVMQFARFAGGSVAFRASLVVAAGAILSSAANVLEDGLKMEWAFLVFVMGTAIILFGLLMLTIAVAARRGQRYFALVPIGTMAGLLLFVTAGGPLMLATWLVAAAFALAPTRKQAEVAPTSP